MLSSFCGRVLINLAIVSTTTTRGSSRERETASVAKVNG